MNFDDIKNKGIVIPFHQAIDINGRGNAVISDSGQFYPGHL
jgi:hypothetical protein